MTSASDIIRLRCLLGALSLSGSTFFANSFSSSLQKSSAMQKISVILSLLIISNLFFFTIKLLIINELAKGKTNYFYSFYPIFYAILIPNSRCQDNASYEHIAWLVVPSADNLHPCLAMAYRWMFRYPPTLGLMVVAPSRPMVKTLIAVCITSFLRRKLRSSINESSTGHSAAGIFRLI